MAPSFASDTWRMRTPTGSIVRSSFAPTDRSTEDRRAFEVPALNLTSRRMVGPAGIAVVPDTNGRVTLFIADFYNGRVRAVAPDGIIRDVGAEANAFGAPTRVAYGTVRGIDRLYVSDSYNDHVVALNIPRIGPNLVRAKPVLPAVLPRKVTG